MVGLGFGMTDNERPLLRVCDVKQKVTSSHKSWRGPNTLGSLVVQSWTGRRVGIGKHHDWDEKLTRIEAIHYLGLTWVCATFFTLRSWYY